MTKLKALHADHGGEENPELKPSVRKRLMDASEQLFAEHGWNAVSIRTIVTAAGVNLAALHYHFGSKEQLLSEIFAARAKPIAEERMRLLAEINLDHAPSIERILEAFLRPASQSVPTAVSGGAPSSDCVQGWRQNRKRSVERFSPAHSMNQAVLS